MRDANKRVAECHERSGEILEFLLSNGTFWCNN